MYDNANHLSVRRSGPGRRPGRSGIHDREQGSRFFTMSLSIVERNTDSWIALKREIRALPCAHREGDSGCCSGQLRREPNGGHSTWLVCDACGETVRKLNLERRQ